MRFRSRKTLVTAAAAAAALTLVAGGATALAESGSSSSGSARSASKTGIALFGSHAIAAPVGSIKACGPLKADGGLLAAAAAYLGLSEEELRNALEGGKSLADVATAQGKSVEGLKQALLDGAKADLDEAVANGDITAEQEQTILSKLRAGIDDFVNGRGGLSVKIEVAGGPGAVFGDPLETAAEYLGLSAVELKQELRSGKSLAEIATAHGKSVSGLKQKLIDAATADLEKAVDELVNQKGLAEPPCDEKVADLSAPDGH
jgi:hypothetical protein